MYVEMLEELDDEIAKLAEREELCLEGRGTEYKWPWTRDKLIRDVGIISGMNARVNSEGYPGDWPVPIKNLVSILRQEQATQDKIDRDEARKEARRELENNRNGRRD